jgi:hypothetical protein
VASLASRIVIPDDVHFRDLDGEAVILSTKSGKYYGLDKVGTRMWNLLGQHGQIEPAYRALLAEYEVSEDVLRRDLLDLVDKLADEGLLRLDDPQDT